MGNIHKDILSPSSSERWINCPKSLIFDRFLDPIKVRQEARKHYLKEGEDAHSWAEYYLKQELMEMGYYEDEVIPPMVGKTPEMEQDGKEYAKYVVGIFCREKMVNTKSLVRVEICVDCSEYAQNCFGTPDAFVVGEKTIYICEYKYGKESVEPHKNTQLMIYGLAVVSMYKEFLDNLEEIDFTIIQPRNGGIKKWTIPKDELIRWGKDILGPSAKRALLPYKEAFQGEWCKYCKGKEFCVEFQGYSRYGYVPSFQKVSDYELKELEKRVLRIEKIKKIIGKNSSEVIDELCGDIDMMNEMVDKYRKVFTIINSEETTRICDDKVPKFVFREYRSD